MRRSDLVFLLSGAAALVYEVVWARLLARLLGGDAIAAGVVVAVFMGGMGLGALLLAPLARRARDPRRLFLALELGLAAWAAASPWLFRLPDPVEGAAARAGLALLFLLAPTLLLGGTFPVMGRLCVGSAGEAGEETSRFYGANTVGAAAGALLAPFVLLPALGLAGTLRVAAALDVVAGLGALALAPAPAQAPAAPRAPRTSHASLAPLGALFALGLASLAYEVVMVRVLVSITGASVYAFAIALAVYLAGIGIGSRQAAGDLAGGGRGPRVLCTAAAMAPALGLAGLAVLRWKLGEDVFGSVANRVVEGASPVRLWTSHALFATFALLGPAIAFGAAFPAGVAWLLESRPDDPREPLFGRAYLANTAGATLGALAAAFLLLPGLGPRAAVGVSLGLALAAALPVLAAAPGIAMRTGGLAVAALVLGVVALRPAAREDERVLDRAVGPVSSAAVHETVEEGETVRALLVDGKVVASTAPVDLRLQRLLAAVPAALHGEVRSALVIGLGTGMTAGTLLDLPSLERLEVVEISSAVVAMAAHFAPWNGGLLEDPRARVRVADGRHALLLEERTYDLVTSDPIHPWTRGSSDLYALEHFERTSAHLAPGGIASQWLPLYQLSTEDVRTVAATWCAAFEHVAAWLTAYDLALVGWNEEPRGLERWWERPLPPRLAASLAEAGVETAHELAALQVADDARLRAFAAGVAPMTENRPVLEFRAPRSFLAGYSVEALAWAGDPAFVPELPPPAREPAREVRAALARFLDRLPEGWTTAARRYGAELVGER